MSDPRDLIDLTATKGKKMNVFVVVGQNYDMVDEVGVFLTREAAEAAAEGHVAFVYEVPMGILTDVK